MALPPSGAISLSQIQTEFGGASPVSLSEYYRGAGLTTPNNTSVPTSGAISLSNFYGAVKQFAFTISSNQTNANLRTLAINAGWDQSAPVIATIGSGVYVSSNSTGTPALTVNGSFPGGVQLINSGFIIGMGGAGGNGRSGSWSDYTNACSISGGSGGSAGGTALNVSVSVSINNAGTIAGGGGGGAGGAGRCNPGVFDNESQSYVGGSFDGGGGGGGGRSSAAANSAGGLRFVQIGTADGNPGTVSTAGTGGLYGPGGTGGDWGAAGGGTTGLSGGAAGAAVSGNSNITWLAFGTRLGAVA